MGMGHTIQLVQCDVGVDVLPPVLVVRGGRNLGREGRGREGG